MIYRAIAAERWHLKAPEGTIPQSPPAPRPQAQTPQHPGPRTGGVCGGIGGKTSKEGQKAEDCAWAERGQVPIGRSSAADAAAQVVAAAQQRHPAAPPRCPSSSCFYCYCSSCYCSCCCCSCCCYYYFLLGRAPPSYRAGCALGCRWGRLAGAVANARCGRYRAVEFGRSFTWAGPQKKFLQENFPYQPI